MPKNDGLVDPKLGKRLVAATRLARDEAKVEAAIKRALAKHKAKALAALKSQHLTAAAPPDPFDDASWDDSVSDEVLPVIGRTLDDLAGTVTKFLKLPPKARGQVLGQIDLSQRTADFTDKVRSIGPDISSRLMDELNQGVALGEGIDKLTKRVDDVFDIGDNIAERIARTETHGAAEGTSYASAGAIADAGFTVTKSWIATNDERTRETHIQAEEDNQDIPIDEPFIVAGLETDYPGNTGDPSEDVNCRCSTTYSSESNDQSDTTDESDGDNVDNVADGSSDIPESPDVSPGAEPGAMINRIDAAKLMYGENSDEYQKAVARWGGDG